VTTSPSIDGDGRPLRLGRGEFQVVVPAETSPETLQTIETLLAQIEGLLDRTAQLHVALESRVVIEQAKGVLAERLGITPDEAFERLRAAARRRRIPLRRLAGAVVEDRADLGG
jgi:AmiR/NasT family two-component response regulator